MSNTKLIPIDLFNNTSTTYDQTKTSLLGRITTKTISGKQVIGAPIIKYRNTLTGPEALTPIEIVITDNNRLFAITSENGGLVTLACYNLSTLDGELTYIGKLNFQLPDSPGTNYTFRGFRVVDDGTTNWKVFILVVANVANHAGLYMINDLALADFQFVPITVNTATLPGQKAVYKLDNSPFNITNGVGIFLDKINQRIYLHRGISSTHSYLRFSYNGTILTVGTLGATTDLFEYETGNLPPLSGSLIQANSEEYHVPTIGPNAGQPSVIFHTTENMYRGRISDLVSASTTWPSLEFANNKANQNEYNPTQLTIRATFAESQQKVILYGLFDLFSSFIMTKDFVNNDSDSVVIISAPENNETAAKEMYKFIPANPVGFYSRQGYLALTNLNSGVSGIYTVCFDCDDSFDSTNIISPVLDVQGKTILRFVINFVRPDLATPIKVYYRTSNFSTPSGGWVAVNDDLDFGSLSSTTGQIQIKLGFGALKAGSFNSTQLYSAGLLAFDDNSISDNWEYSHDDSSPGNPSIAAFRLKKAYTASVPELFFRARDLSNNLYVQSSTVADSALFEYSTDGGVNWLPLGTIPNTVGTLVRYTFATPPGIDVRPSIRES